MPVRSDVAIGLNGVKQALAGVFVTFVDVAVLSLTRIVPCFRSQSSQEISAKNLHVNFLIKLNQNLHHAAFD